MNCFKTNNIERLIYKDYIIHLQSVHIQLFRFTMLIPELQLNKYKFALLMIVLFPQYLRSLFLSQMFKPIRFSLELYKTRQQLLI